MNALLKLTSLALVVALGIVLAGHAAPAGATPTSLTVNGSSSATTVTLGTAVPVIATFVDEGTGGFTLFSTASNTIGYFLSGPTLTQNNDGQTIAGNDASMPNNVTVSEDADATGETTVLQAFFYCNSAGTTQIYFTQGGGASSQITVTCGSSATSTVSVSPTSAAIGGAATVTGTCTAASQPLVASTGGYFTTSPSNGTYVSSQQVNCITAGTVVATFYCSSTATVTFTLNGATAYLYCGSSSSGITVSPTTVSLNGAATVTGTCTAAGQTLVASGGGGYFTTSASNGTYVSGTQINCVTTGSIVATFYCTATVTETFTLNGATGTLYCGSSGSSTVTVNPTTGTGTTITGTCTAGALLSQTGPASITAATLNGQYVTTGVAAGSVSCSTSGTLVATLTCNSAGNVYISLSGGSATFVCSAGTSYNPYSGYNPYNTNPYATNCGYSVSYCPPSAAAGASALSVTASASSVSCGGSSAISVAVKGPNGAAAVDGTTVQLSTTAGTVSPNTATTSGGAVQALFTAPSSGNASASITASAGSATGSTSVSVSCAPQVTQPAVSAPPPPPVANVASTGPLVISPPNTGDAGLKANDGNLCIDAAVTAP